MNEDKEKITEQFTEQFMAWQSNMYGGWVRANILFALNEAGVFSQIKANPGATVATIAKACDLEEPILLGALNFLAFTDKVIAKRGDGFYLGENARFLDASNFLGTSKLFVGGYKVLLENLLPALRRKQVYGQDFQRDAGYVAEGTHVFTQEAHQLIAEELRSRGVRHLVDLGCGSGQALARFCQELKLLGVGIDHAPAAINLAQANVEAQGLSERVRFLAEDIENVESWAGQAGDVGALMAHFVLHEFLLEGSSRLQHFLSALRQKFAGRMLVVAEFISLSDREFHALNHEQSTLFSLYQHIVHKMSSQGEPITHRAWLDHFATAKFELLKVDKIREKRINIYYLRI